MKNNINYSPISLKDLDDIWDYIEKELSNLNAAKNTVEKIMRSVDQLEEFAEIGTPLSSIIEIENDYRFLISGNYMVFYRVHDKKVYVDRILYRRRNYLSILFPDLPE